jgi:hypothetical protein
MTEPNKQARLFFTGGDPALIAHGLFWQMFGTVTEGFVTANPRVAKARLDELA